MVKVAQIRRGIEKYIDREIMPHLTPAKAFGLGVYLELLLTQTEAKYMQYLEMPAVKALGITDDSGAVDLDRIRDVAMGKISDRITFDIPAIGRITITKDDVDKLYNLIREG